MKKTKNTCLVCEKAFTPRELYPTSLIRDSAIGIASQYLPKLHNHGYVCHPDLRKITALYYEKILLKELGEITDLEREVLDSLQQQDVIAENINEEYEENLSYGDYLADQIAKFGGSWGFIILFFGAIILWTFINTIQLINQPFDPYPFILLNLVLSCLAAIQAPVIMMSQNRQAAKDRLRQENDYQVNLKAELLVRQINSKLDQFMRHSMEQMEKIINGTPALYPSSLENNQTPQIPLAQEESN